MAWKEAQSGPALSPAEGPSRDEEASGGAATLGPPEDHSSESAQETGSTLSESAPFNAQVPAPWAFQCP